MAQTRTFIEPVYLYRYRSLKNLQHELSSIRENYLWCSQFEELNDPMEGSYEASIMLRKNVNFAVIREQIYGDKGAIGICSFSETNDHELMWAHYANQFKGICIEYYFPHLLKALGGECDFVRIFYNEKTHRVFPKSVSDPLIAKRLLATKSHRWLYEREWRLMTPTNGRLPLGRGDCISRVFLGNRITDQAKRELVRVCEQQGIRHRMMAIDGYSISFRAPNRNT